MRDLLPALPDEPFADHLPHIVRVEVVNIGESSARVFRLFDESGPVSYLKIEPRADGESIIQESRAEEAARLRWLAGRLPVPQVTVRIMRMLRTVTCSRLPYPVLISQRWCTRKRRT